jgi:hypothetical protein
MGMEAGALVGVGGATWLGSQNLIGESKMELSFSEEGFTRGLQIYQLLFKSGRLCAEPDCPQPVYNGVRYCYAHQKVKDGLFSLEVQVGGGIYEDYE